MKLLEKEVQQEKELRQEAVKLTEKEVQKEKELRLEAVKLLEKEVQHEKELRQEAVKRAEAEVDRRLLDLLFGAEYDGLRTKMDKAKAKVIREPSFLKTQNAFLDPFFLKYDCGSWAGGRDCSCEWDEGWEWYVVVVKRGRGEKRWRQGGLSTEKERRARRDGWNVLIYLPCCIRKEV